MDKYWINSQFRLSKILCNLFSLPQWHLGDCEDRLWKCGSGLRKDPAIQWALQTRNVLWWCRSSVSSNKGLPLLSLVQSIRAMLLAEKSDTVSPKGLHTCCSYALRRSAAPDSQVSDPPFPSTGHVFLSFIFSCYCCCEHDDGEWESAHDYVQVPKETGTGHQNPGAAGAGGCDPKWVLGFKPKSSKRAASPLKCWAIFPVPEYCFKIFGWIAVYLQMNSTVWSPPVLTLLWTPERAGRSSHSDASHWRRMGGDSGSAVQVSRKATIVPQVSQPGLGNYSHSSYTCAIVTRLFLSPHSHPKTWIPELQC